MRSIEQWTAVAALLLFAGLRCDSEHEEKAMDEERDREEILQHIHGIFGAYLRQDRDAIRRMHTEDWTGFQGPSTSIERGIDAYMKNAEASLESLRGTGYELLDVEVQLHGDLALVYYVARYDTVDAEGEAGSVPLRSVDVYRRGTGGWNQCGSHIAVVPTDGPWAADARSGSDSTATPRTLSDKERAELMFAREEVWRAFFGHDIPRLKELVPEEAVALDAGVEVWADQAGILARSASLRESGGELLRLEFPRTTVQAYGPVAVLYTAYLYELRFPGGERKTSTGRGTEIFVQRDGRWQNSGWHLDADS